eukprot:scaffold13881_cov124-Isochrysis_galbana.AAC.10
MDRFVSSPLSPAASATKTVRHPASLTPAPTAPRGCPAAATRRYPRGVPCMLSVQQQATSMRKGTQCSPRRWAATSSKSTYASPPADTRAEQVDQHDRAVLERRAQVGHQARLELAALGAVHQLRIEREPQIRCRDQVHDAFQLAHAQPTRHRAVGPDRLDGGIARDNLVHLLLRWHSDGTATPKSDAQRRVAAPRWVRLRLKSIQQE